MFSMSAKKNLDLNLIGIALNLYIDSEELISLLCEPSSAWIDIPL